MKDKPGSPEPLDEPPTRAVGGPANDAATSPGESRAISTELRVLQLLRRVIRAVDIYNRKLRSEYAITAPQLVTLQNVMDRGPISVAEIAKGIHLGSSTLVGILDRLESRGLVKRSRSDQDRRVVLVTATEAGRELGGNAPSPLQDRLADGLRGLSDDEQRAIESALGRIVDLMEAGDLDASPYLDTGRLDAD